MAHPKIWLAFACLLGVLCHAFALQLATQANRQLTTSEGTGRFEMNCPVTSVVGQVLFSWGYSPARHLVPGNQIVQSPKYSFQADALIVNQVSRTDAGFYTASVTDDTRRVVTCTIEVLVGYAPELVENFPKTFMANFSRTFVLTCPVRGVPLPEVVWRKDGRTLAPSQNVRFNGLDLNVISVSEQDRGQYQCTASNQFGHLQSQVTVVNIQWPLRFVQVPPSVIDLREGQNISLLCNVTGFPHARILWYRNDEMLTNTSHQMIDNWYDQRVSWSYLSFDTLNVSDNGLYKCEATNVNTQIVHDFELVVHAPPVITSSHPPVSRAHIGMKLILQCTATGFPPPKFTWYYNGMAIPRVGNTHVNEGWDGILTINDVVTSDAGNYTCQAVNDVGYAYSETTRLDVFGIYFLERAPPQVAVEEGNSTELPCEVGGADQGVMILWLRDGIPIQSQCTPQTVLNSPNCKYIIMNNTLHLLRVSLQDLGTYTCRAKELGKVNPETIEASSQVLLAVPVVIYPRLKDMYVGDEGKPMTLECKARGSPPPTVEWLYRGLHLLNDSHRMISGGTIKFRRLLVRDSGHYLCLARNNITESRQDIRIHVNSVPALLNLNIEVKGRTVALEWNMVGDGGYPVTSFKYEYRQIAPSIGKWSRGKLAPDVKSHTFRGLNSNATYELKMWAVNKLGRGTVLRQMFGTSPAKGLLMGLSEKNVRLIYIGSGVAGGLFLLILVVAVLLVCRRKPDASAQKRGQGVEDGQALVDAIQESPSHVNPAYHGAPNPDADLMELHDVAPTDSEAGPDKNGKVNGKGAEEDGP